MLKSAWIINLWLKQTRNRIALPTFIPWIFYLDLLIVRTAWNKLKQITVLCSQDYTDKAEYIRKAGGYFPPNPNSPPPKPYSFTCLGLKAFCGDVWNLLLFHARLTLTHSEQRLDWILFRRVELQEYLSPALWQRHAGTFPHFSLCWRWCRIGISGNEQTNHTGSPFCVWGTK